MGKCRRVCFGVFSILAIADIIAFSIMYSPVMNKEKHNNLLKNYTYHQDCLVFNESNKNTYTLKVNNSYYQLTDVSILQINSTIDCFISPMSNIAYLNMDLQPNQLAYTLLILGMLGLFITGSLIRICVDTNIIKFEDTTITNKIDNQKPKTIQKENKYINSSDSMYFNPNNNKEKDKLLKNNDLPKFYDISLIED